MALLARALAALLLCAASASRAAVVAQHPVEKVIGLLGGLIDKVKAEGQKEEVLYAKFAHWCKTSTKTLEGAIADEKAAIEELSSTVQSKTEEAALLKDQMADLDAELAKLQAADLAADKVRQSEAGVFATAEADLASTITAVEQAIAALEAAETTTDSLLLAQRKVQEVLVLSEASASDEQREALMAFVQQGTTPRPSLKAQGDHKKHVKKYAFKSNSVIEMLKQLKLKFEDEKLAATKGETNALNAHALAKAARADLSNKASASKDAKAAELVDAESALSAAQGSLSSTQDDLKADSATLDQTEKACAVKKSEWAARSDTRSKELEAMKAAIEILSKATGVRTKAPENPVPPPAPVSLLELAAPSSDPRARALELLRASARASHSHAMERLAEEVAAHLTGPFDQVNNMIQKMIFRLMDEQKDEDKHKNWCDLELNKTDISKLDKESRMAQLKAKIDDAEATVQTLTSEIKAADAMVQSIAEHMAEATRIRETGKAENKEAVKDSRDAQTALSSAIAVLEAFYKDSGMVKKEAWELLQRDPLTLPAEPATWGSSYTGTTDPMEQPAGIIAVLKKVSASFASMEAQTLAQEESDQKLFEEEMKLNDIEKARRTKESEVKAQEKKRLVEKIASLTSSRKHVSDEKEAVEQYFRDLQHACVNGDSTYEDRKAARTKEIDGLKEAQMILASAFEDNGTTTTTSSPSPSFLRRRLLAAQ